MNAAPQAPRARSALLLVGLFLAATLPYAATLGFPFISYDDPDYVSANFAVQGGLSWSGVRWACGAMQASNWHPLTWLAHMLDVELFGAWAGGHHASSVLLHGLNSVLCFLALRALTARAGLAASVALLFALHPLRVESVAWVSERKDVLSGACFFLLLLAWARHARRPGPGPYLLALCAAAAGLLAKPMLVSAPLVLLLLELFGLPRARRAPARIALELAPFALLAAGSALLTVHAQRAGGALNTLEFLPLDARLANVPVALLTYLQHFLVPRGLCYFYPHRALALDPPRALDAGALAALLGLLVLLFLAWRARRREPLVLLGTLWCLVMLAPVIGVVQVGEQALADRYAYLPLVGLQLALASLLAPFAVPRPRLSMGLGLACAAALALLTVRQVQTWRDGRTLYARALAVTERNYPAHVGLASELAARGDRAGAKREHEAALAVRPSYAPALYGLGLLAQEDGQSAVAIELYRRALASLPGLAAAELNLGALLAQGGDAVGAAQCFERVLEREPDQPDARLNLAQLLLASGELAGARAELETLLATHPRHGAGWTLLGELGEREGDHRAALAALEQALAAPDGPRRLDAVRLLCWLLATAAEPELRDPARALRLAEELAAARREDPPALEARAAALAAAGERERAAALLEQAAAGQVGGAAARLTARARSYRAGELYLHSH